MSSRSTAKEEIDLGVLLEETNDGVRMEVRAHPSARRNAIAGVHDGALKVDVTAAPEKGKANKAIQKLLASVMRIPKRNLLLVSGETSGRKGFLLTGVTIEEVREKLNEIT